MYSISYLTFNIFCLMYSISCNQISLIHLLEFFSPWWSLLSIIFSLMIIINFSISPVGIFLPLVELT